MTKEISSIFLLLIYLFYLVLLCYIGNRGCKWQCQSVLICGCTGINNREQTSILLVRNSINEYSG